MLFDEISINCAALLWTTVSWIYTSNWLYFLVELMWSHTTKSMCVSYMSAECTHPQSLVTRLTPGKVSQVPFTSGIGLHSETQAPA